MNIYGERINVKFNNCMKDIIKYDWTNAPNPPCLILLHPSIEQNILDLYNKHKDAINNRQAAVLVVSTSVCEPPVGANSDFFHCLSYGIPNTCENDLIKTRFNKLIEQVRQLTDWSNVDMRRLWEKIDPPYPEHLVAWYLLLIAKERGVKVEEPSGLSCRAKQEFEMLCVTQGITNSKFNRSEIAKLLSKTETLRQSG